MKEIVQQLNQLITTYNQTLPTESSTKEQLLEELEKKIREAVNLLNESIINCVKKDVNTLKDNDFVDLKDALTVRLEAEKLLRKTLAWTPKQLEAFRNH